MKVSVLCLWLILTALLADAGIAHAGSGPVWQTISGPSGFQIQVPNGWTARPFTNPGSSLQETIASADDQEHANIYVTPLQISLAELPLFASTYLGNEALSAPMLAPPQPSR